MLDEKNRSEEEFIGSVDVESLKKDLNMDLEQIGKIAGLKSWRNIYKWDKAKSNSGSRPSYNTMIRLIQAGARVETLFGLEYKSNKIVITEKSKMTDQEFLDGMIRAMSAVKELSQKMR